MLFWLDSGTFSVILVDRMKDEISVCHIGLVSRHGQHDGGSKNIQGMPENMRTLGCEEEPKQLEGYRSSLGHSMTYGW